MSTKNKDNTISFRVTQNELALVNKQAQKANMNRSDYIVHTLLNNESNGENNLITGFLEKYEYYLIQFKNNEISKEEFLQNTRSEVNYLWHSLK